MIRKAIKGTEFKLKYNFINFEECLNQFNKEKSVHIDLSLMPKFKMKMNSFCGLQALLSEWQLEGKRSFLQFQTIFQKAFKIDQAEIPVAAEPSKEENAEMIINYFKSEDFIKNNKISS